MQAVKKQLRLTQTSSSFLLLVCAHLICFF